MSGVLEQLRDRARTRPRRIVFPEGRDPRVLGAAADLASQGMGIPILLDPPTGTVIPDGIEHVDTREPIRSGELAAVYQAARASQGVTLENATAALEDPLLYGALMVRHGLADLSVAGSVATSAEVLRAAMRGVGPSEETGLVSSFFMMELATGQVVSFGDCAVVPDPTAEELARIGISTADNHARLTGEEPRIAFLSFSTKGSARHARVDKVREAFETAQKARPDIRMDGELQFDAAFVPEIAGGKSPDSDVAGLANVFVFPDLDSGNIAYKITQRLAGATALGPLIQGLARPCMDLSRGCSQDDIVDVAVVASQLVDD